MAIVDADFLSSFFKIGKLTLILRALGLKQLTIPSTAYEELKEAPFFNEIASLFAFNERELDQERFILVKPVNLVPGKENLTTEEIITCGKGEWGCFILAKSSGDTILIDDQRARMIATEQGLKVASIPSFLLFCKRKNIVSADELQQIIHDLKIKDYYEFSEESKELLLK